MSSPASLRGRPSIATPEVARGHGWLGCEDRIAWLLRTNRLFGPDSDLAVGSTFARAFGGGDFGRTVDRSQVTRWERVYQRADHAVLRRYEQLLQLRQNTLVAIADYVYRESVGTAGASVLARKTDPGTFDVLDRTGELMEQALSNDTMSGHDWDELSANLSVIPNVLLVGRHSWSDLAERLLGETIIADGTGWIQRLESVNRLMGHRAGQASVIAACAALVADRTNQVFIEPLTMLELTPHPDAARLLLRQIANPTNEHAQRGAWLAAAEKVARGHFGPSDLITLGARAAEVLQSRQHMTCQLAAAELLHQMPPAISAPVIGGLSRVAAGDPASRQVLESGRTAAAGVAAAAVAQIRSAATRLLPRDALDSDPMLDRLLEEMLFHPQISRRTTASKLIEATPYRRPVATALCSELRRSAVLANAPVAAAMVSGLPYPGEPDLRQATVERLILAKGISPTIAEAAAWKLGHVRGHSDDGFWTRALTRHLPAAGATASGASIARGLVYALGQGRQSAHLRRLQRDANLPPAVRAAAAWWLNRPTHVLQSTTHD